MFRIVLWILLACAHGVAATAQPRDCAAEIRPPLLEPATRDGSAHRTIYGWQLMTQQERADFLARWRAARTAAEQSELHRRHHQAMNARARARGVELRGPLASAAAGADVAPSLPHRCGD